SVSSQQGKQQSTRLFLPGDHPRLDDVCAVMSERLDVPPERLSRSLDPLPDRYPLAWGLALKEGMADYAR
ncbi:pilus assembly protein PilM, partial [Geobacillus stearothermophilus]|nr:pilus assembly protein PilM [Geobacillus stearothermophilus]